MKKNFLNKLNPRNCKVLNLEVLNNSHVSLKIKLISYRVCEYIYEQRQDWEKVFECYIDDTSRHGDILSFLRNVFTESVASNIRLMERSVLKHIQLLVQLNATSLAVFLAVNKPTLIDEAVTALIPFPRERYHFLEAILDLA
jgi:hypothetical protein